MPRIQFKITRHIKKLENITYIIEKAINEGKPWDDSDIELADKDFKVAMIPMLIVSQQVTNKISNNTRISAFQHRASFPIHTLPTMIPVYKPETRPTRRKQKKSGTNTDAQQLGKGPSRWLLPHSLT